MKKYCLVALLTLCLTLCLAGCGDKQEIIVPDVQDDPIHTVFDSSFEVDNIEKYDFTLIFESNQDFNVYEIVDRTLEKTSVQYKYNDNIYTKDSTAEHDPFDLFVYRNSQFYSMWDLVSRNRLNFDEVKHLVDKYSLVYDEEYENQDKIFAEDLIDSLKTNELLSYPIYNNSGLAMINAYFQLKSEDYTWAVLNVDDITGYFDCVFIAGYETPEQKTAILNAIEYRKSIVNENKVSKKMEETLANNQKIYEMKDRNLIIYFSAMYPKNGVYEFIENYIEQ